MFDTEVVVQRQLVSNSWLGRLLLVTALVGAAGGCRSYQVRQYTPPGPEPGPPPSDPLVASVPPGLPAPPEPGSPAPLPPTTPPLPTSLPPGGVTTSKPPPAAPLKSAQIKRAELEDFSLRAGKLVVNNFCLTETPDRLPEHAVLKLGACYRSRLPDLRTFYVTVVGMDANCEILWACHIDGVAEPGGVGVLREVALPVPAGTLEATATVGLRLQQREGAPGRTATWGGTAPILPRSANSGDTPAPRPD
jgi:hypothetical protein